MTKPFLIENGVEFEAIDLLEGIVGCLTGDLPVIEKIGDQDVIPGERQVYIKMFRSDFDQLWLLLEKSKAALAAAFEEDKRVLMALAESGAARPDPSTRLGRQLERFTTPPTTGRNP